ncbi:MAG: DNA-directed RNA polymerase subunit omega [Streptococcaceae bacterium]|jgi:DNA-directed RNA polymerase subunit omega|nr:DNA-directed RNA polymerase subunit omega [Streptococcaceae bacterium]
MILESSIDKLLSKVESKYSLAILASKRAHELQKGEAPTMKFKSIKNLGKALEEIAAANVYPHSDPNEKRKRMYKKKESRLAAAKFNKTT